MGGHGGARGGIPRDQTDGLIDAEEVAVMLAKEGARNSGIPLVVRPVPPRAEAMAVDEMWLSSSTKEVLAITTVDGKPFGGGKPGPVFRRM